MNPVRFGSFHVTIPEARNEKPIVQIIPDGYSSVTVHANKRTHMINTFSWKIQELSKPDATITPQAVATTLHEALSANRKTFTHNLGFPVFARLYAASSPSSGRSLTIQS